MTIRVEPLIEPPAPVEDAGLGSLVTDAGNLPLDQLDIQTRITGLVAHTVVSQGFRNPYAEPLEATYIFPLPDRAAVTAMRMEAAGRTVEAVLQERGEARRTYDQAIRSGQRASIAEQERADVFTMRVGNILPGERVTVRLTLAGPLPTDDNEATFRFPLVVAPRYIPGTPIDDPVGDGVMPDTDAVPDASRITPPVLLPGFPNPVRLGIEAQIDAAGLPLSTVHSSLHTVTTESEADGTLRLRIQPGERVDRDFILRLRLAPDETAAEGTPESETPIVSTLVLAPDAQPEASTSSTPDTQTAPSTLASGVSTSEPAGAEGTNGFDFGTGTFTLTVLPPPLPPSARPRDVVLLLDRSGSMGGWKIIAARRAAARIVDTLTQADRFAVFAFDHSVDSPPTLPSGLVPASDRHRFRAVEFLASMGARGGTEMLQPLLAAADLLSQNQSTSASEASAGERDAILVLVTDGQVGNEDQILRELSPRLGQIRIHTVGIDRAVNAGFLSRLAVLGRGRCELVESEDRLDEAMARIHRRIAAPVVTGLTLIPEGLDPIQETIAPHRLPDLFPGAPLTISGRLARTPAVSSDGSVHGDRSVGAFVVTGRTLEGKEWRLRVPAVVRDNPAATAIWARGHLRDLEDRYATLPTLQRHRGVDEAVELERRIIAASLRFGVLCRFTAFVAVDTRVVTDGDQPHRVTQPVELPSGWDPAAVMPVAGYAGGVPAPGAAPPPAPAGAPPAPGGAIQPTLMAFGGAPEFAARPGPVAPAGSPPRRPAGRAILGRSMGRMKAGRVPAVPVPGAPGTQPRGEENALDSARGQITDELRALQRSATLPWYERQMLLADLASRLQALVEHLRERGVAHAELEQLRSLADRLNVCEAPGALREADLEALWRDALQTLERFTTTVFGPSSSSPNPGGSSGGSSGGTGQTQSRRWEFWKRG